MFLCCISVFFSTLFAILSEEKHDIQMILCLKPVSSFFTKNCLKSLKSLLSLLIYSSILLMFIFVKHMIVPVDEGVLRSEISFRGPTQGQTTSEREGTKYTLKSWNTWHTIGSFLEVETPLRERPWLWSREAFERTGKYVRSSKIVPI
jgi:hypothetical protein